ncbi:hypothetical protein D3C76_1769880 [compost metagenome]
MADHFSPITSLRLNPKKAARITANSIFRGSLFVDEARCQAICLALRGRIGRLQDIVYARVPNSTDNATN